MAGKKPIRAWQLALALLAIAAVIGAVVKLTASPASQTTAAATASRPDTGPVFNDLITDETERLAYIASLIELVDLQVGPDQKPDDAGPVPGLFRVSGVIKNNGDRAISQANLMINPRDDKDQVVGSYVEDILHGRRLGPRDSKPFRFQIPERPNSTGRFSHSLK